MSGETVSDIELRRIDKNGLTIEAIYHKVDQTYVIYANEARLAIQYADEPKLATEQRAALAPLAPLRGQINGLIDGWRTGLDALLIGPKEEASKARARRWDRRTADALVVALQGDQVTAEALLQGIKTEILDERNSAGRAQYVLIAGCAAFGVFGLMWLCHVWQFPYFVNSLHLWKATALGCLGAFFSIATKTSDRTIQSDLRLRDNLIDATIRILIGAISAIVLFALLNSQIVSFQVGSATATNPDFLIVVGFLAGFSEQLVGNLLTTKVEPAIRAVAVPASAVASATPPGSSETATKSADEKNPRGIVHAATAAQDEVDDSDDHEHTETCLCDTEWDESLATEDVELPQAVGGVENKAN